jgi:outer membrane receptor protein involved in Fe transport
MKLRRTATSLAALSSVWLAHSAVAQETAAAAPPGADSPAAPPEDERRDADEIVVVATRLPGEVVTNQPPIVTLGEAEIASYGAGSVQDLLAAIAPQTGSGRGRGSGGPVVLLNGQRISGFRELRNVPPEAIRRVEVLPEEVALQFGFRPDQRVVNFILKDRYSAVTTEVNYGVPGKGGYSSRQLETSLMRIDGKSRLNVTGTVARASSLTEAERGIVQPTGSGSAVAGDPDPAQFRTLLPETRSVGVNATWSRPLGRRTTLSLNGAADKSYSTSRFGLNGTTLTAPGGSAIPRTFLFPDPLERVGDILTASVGAALNSQFGNWRLAATGDYSHVESNNRTDRRADASAIQAAVAAGLLSPTGALPLGSLVTFSPDFAQTDSETATGLLTLSGRPFHLPAGDISLTAKAGFDYRAIESSDTRRSALPVNLDRSAISGGLNVDLPIASRREDVLAGLGDLALNLNGDLERLSDFGTLIGYGAGLTWSPTERLTLQASYIAKAAAPGLSDLGGAVLVTPNVTLFDFRRGETVLATVTTGGNPDLREERQRDLKFGLNWELPVLKNSNFVAEYFRNRSYDTTNGFPLLTPAIEAAFPARVTRDAAGRLIAVDQRPVTFAEERGERLRYGFNLSGAFGKPDPNARRGPMGMIAGAGRGGPGGMGADRAGGGSGGGGGQRIGGGGQRMGGGGRGGFGGGDGRGRWNLSIYHTIRFEQSVRIADAGALLDLLDGDAISGGGVARHGLEIEGGGFYRGFGLRASGSYTGATHIDGSGLPGSTRLDFHPFARFDLRVFADLGQQRSLVKAVPFLKGSRVSLRVNNVFDAQQRVTDANGLVPLSYQPGFLDPQGRLFRVELRKQF